MRTSIYRLRAGAAILRLAALLLTAACMPAQAGMADLINGVKVGAQLPALDLHYFGSAPLQEGRLTLIDFWATWCEPCRTSIPALNALQARFAEQGLRVIGVTQESETLVAPFLKIVPMRYASAADGMPSLYQALHIKALPYAIFVTPGGKIIWRGQPDEIDDALVENLLHK